MVAVGIGSGGRWVSAKQFVRGVGGLDDEEVVAVWILRLNLEFVWLLKIKGWTGRDDVGGWLRFLKVCGSSCC